MDKYESKITLEPELELAQACVTDSFKRNKIKSSPQSAEMLLASIKHFREVWRFCRAMNETTRY